MLSKIKNKYMKNKMKEVDHILHWSRGSVRLNKLVWSIHGVLVLMVIKSQFWRMLNVMKINDEILKGESKYITYIVVCPSKMCIERL